MSRPIRPTMTDVAREAGVGVATVDRVLNRRAPVKAETARRVFEAAQHLKFHGTTLLRQRIEDAGRERTLGFLLQKSQQSFYQAMARELTRATRSVTAFRGKPLIHFLEDLTPRNVADRLIGMLDKVDALAVVAADHPSVNDAMRRAVDRGIPVFTLLSDLDPAVRTDFVGIDHRKAGRTAAWAVARLAKRPGPVAIVVGSHRYHGHDLCEVSFRASLRERAPAFRILDTLTSFEDAQFAQESTRDLLKRTPDLRGLYVTGGGIEGVIDALREHGSSDITMVCNELVPATRAALIEGIADVVIATPIELLATRAVDLMAAALDHRTTAPAATGFLPFQIFISENV